ncbi:MAG: preprotein translocase subunit SecG [Methylocella sp.]
MQQVLIVVHLMIVVVLVVVVLLQRSEGGALGVGGTGGFMTGRGQASALTRATAVLAALFFATSMGLTILARFNQAPEITFQSLTPIEPEGGAAKQGEGKGSLLDQLRQMEDRAAKPPALPPGLTLPGQIGPAAPAAPQGLNLPPLKQPATPLVPAAPAQTTPATPPAPPASIMVRPAAPQGAAGRGKANPRDYELPWSK